MSIKWVEKSLLTRCFSFTDKLNKIEIETINTTKQKIKFNVHMLITKVRTKSPSELESLFIRASERKFENPLIRSFSFKLF